MTVMAKKVKPKQYVLPEEIPSSVQEPQALYLPTGLKKIPTVEEFTYRRFQKIADKIPFTLTDWANILHLSERTLQRYAKNNTSLEGIYVDRILHIEQLIDMGLQAFTNSEALYRWLKRDKTVLGNMLTLESLSSTQGIQLVIDEIGRILYGVYI
jgi:putative toxin-antitoxin system antitoxin component (TIGR02293 family)